MVFSPIFDPSFLGANGKSYAGSKGDKKKTERESEIKAKFLTFGASEI